MSVFGSVILEEDELDSELDSELSGSSCDISAS